MIPHRKGPFRDQSNLEYTFWLLENVVPSDSNKSTGPKSLLVNHVVTWCEQGKPSAMPMGMIPIDFNLLCINLIFIYFKLSLLWWLCYKFFCKQTRSSCPLTVSAVDACRWSNLHRRLELSGQLCLYWGNGQEWWSLWTESFAHAYIIIILIVFSFKTILQYTSCLSFLFSTALILIIYINWYRKMIYSRTLFCAFQTFYNFLN